MVNTKNFFIRELYRAITAFAVTGEDSSRTFQVNALTFYKLSL
jgi:hypothetical protein